MAVSNRIKNQHLLWRAGFGPMAELAADLDTMPQKKLWNLLVKTSEKSPQKLDVASDLFGGLVKGMQDFSQFDQLDKYQKKELQQQSREDLKNLNLRWLDEMISSEAQLRERMSLFWHGHFACRVINIFYQQQLLDVIRTNALTNFGDLLRAVSKSPAMLQFLNNQQNKKKHPNENFAREVMELFTMGRGNYTENDIKEAARAFTGWGFNLQGEFVFRKNQHDDGVKTVLGKTGNFTGDDIIDILLEQKQTAKYITQKMYKYFVNEKVDTAKADLLATRFYASKYDIKKLMEDIFTSDWFYDEKNIGTKIKSPVELLAGIRRLLPLQLQNDTAQLLFQRALGQILFYPPNVAGWPGGKSWIDSSTLMLRLRIPQIITANETINIRPKSDDDTMMGQMMEEKMKQRQNKEYASKGGTAIVDWEMVAKVFAKTPREQLLQKISDTVLQTKSRVSNEVLNKYLNNESRENFIKSAIINLMSTPEYQLC
ncbi:DUF1800 domain-containing protein [Ferruginibacter lapsinanis]|uniref:DUF1800 domain-containing protein n=1 Tax=Ferruginibacter lapsinanis TaxID=563172 RepID=UPI001E3EFB9C|nr:DUF1800 domain-containing protein [Ferruginibacter lapsinanis]UEG50486.1 DUF1800 domain-containing protein [Ferruginibacter lapsinanis]